MLPEQDQQKPLSPHLVTMEVDDDIIDNDISATDEASLSPSSGNNVSLSQDGYDTDIESGEFSFRINGFIGNLFFF
jgi:hypothetical protein